MPEIAGEQAELLAQGLPKRIASTMKSVGGREVLRSKTGISVSQLRRYTEGISQPTAKAILAISMAGGVSVNWLLTGQDQPARSAHLELKEEDHDYFNYVVADRESDIEALIFIVITIENSLFESGKEISIDKKAQTIAAFFDLYRASGNAIDKEAISNLINVFSNT